METKNSPSVGDLLHKRKKKCKYGKLKHPRGRRICKKRQGDKRPK